jgi:hypothetical protein
MLSRNRVIDESSALYKAAKNGDVAAAKEALESGKVYIDAVYVKVREAASERASTTHCLEKGAAART